MSTKNFEDYLINQFYGNTTFVHHEALDIIPEDTLSISFSHPRVKIKNDTLYLSYIEKTNEYGSGFFIQKVDQKMALSDINNLTTINSTYGTTDTFKPNLTYLGFEMLTNNVASIVVYEINNSIEEYDANQETELTLLYEDAPYVTRFPFKFSENSLEIVKAYIRQLQQ
jgi:hypothetical protein